MYPFRVSAIAVLVLFALVGCNPGYVNHVNRGHAYMQSGNNDMALAEFNAAIAANPQYALAYNNRAAAYLNQNEYDLALADCNRAIELAPKLNLAYLNRGRAYVGKQKYDLAIADLNRAMELGFMQALVYMTRGMAYLGKEQYGQAIRDFGRAIELAPSAYDVRCLRGFAYCVRKQQDSAIADLSRTIEFAPHLAVAYCFRARAYSGKGETELALADCNKALEINPEFALAYVYRGGILHTKGDYGSALKDYGRAIELAPEEVAGHAARASLYYDQGFAAAALRDCNFALGILAKEEAHLNQSPRCGLLGLKALIEGDHEAALRHSRKAVELNPRSSSAYEMRGLAYYGMGQTSLAVSDWHMAQSLRAGSPSHPEARRLLGMAEPVTRVPTRAAPQWPSWGADSLLSGLPTSEQNPEAVAVVIGVENYQEAPKVEYAVEDAEAVKRYLMTAFGYRDENIIFLENPGKADLEEVFGSVASPQGKLYNWVKPGKSDVFVYYAGHGAPSLQDKKGYLVPVDASPDYVHVSGYPLELLYANLAKVPARSMTVVIDACFSGAVANAQGGAEMLIGAASPFVVPAVAEEAPADMTVLTAGTGSQVASWYPEKGHSLFTYWFLKGLKGEADSDKDGVVRLGELGGYLSENVTYTARRLYGREQTPEVKGKPSAEMLRLK